MRPALASRRDERLQSFGEIAFACIGDRATQGHIAEVVRRLRGWTVSRFRAAEPSDAPEFQAQRQRVSEGMRLAGLPE